MVSILLTCYNHMRFLPDAYRSVLEQTYGDFELLAIDDGSKDGTREWLSQHSDPRLRLVFNRENLGTYASLNVGIAAARGDFVAILNDDDLWAPDKLATQVSAFETNPRLGLVHTGGWFIDENGNRHSDSAPMGFPYPDLHDGDVLLDLVERNQVITSSVLLRREVFDKCGLFDPAYYGCGDWHMWLRIAASFQVAQIREPMTFYRVHDENAAWNSQKMLEDDVRVREWLSAWSPFVERPDSKPALAHNWACLGTEYTRLGDRSKGRQAYSNSIRQLPTRLKSYARWAMTFLPGGQG